MRNTIRDGFAADDLDAAHGPLHDVGHTLATIESLAQKQGLEGESLTAVQDAVKVLKEKFAAVDQMMHGGEGSEYSEVSADVDAALAALVTASGADAAGGHTDKDHDH